MPDPKYVIHTGRDGELDTTTPQHIEQMIEGIRETGKLVIHLHGGLVSAPKARAKADELLPVYQGAGAYPVFFVYETGVLEIVRNNWREIGSERIFKLLLRKLLKYAVGKLTNIEGAKATGAYPMPNDIEVGIALRNAEAGKEPFEEIEVTNNELLAEPEEKRFTDDLATDIRVQEELQAIVNGAADFEEMESTAKGVTSRHKASTETLMSPAVVDELVKDASEKEGKGVFSSAKFIVKAGKVLARVISRHVNNRDHGAYATVVEELLREYYLANVGATVWGAMKKETADTFDRGDGSTIRGGRYFVEQLGKLLAEPNAPEVTIVAHSLGSVFACNLLDHLLEAKASGEHPLPAKFRLRDLIFMAPAVSHERFAETLAHGEDLFGRFRSFNLSDQLESGYWEVPALYPRSLLYMVAGLFEVNKDGKGAYDKPLVGMQRYENDHLTYQAEGVPEVRAFFQRHPDSLSYSIADGPNGKATDAVRHGGFDDWNPPAPRKTMESVAFLIGQS